MVCVTGQGSAWSVCETGQGSECGVCVWQVRGQSVMCV